MQLGSFGLLANWLSLVGYPSFNAPEAHVGSLPAPCYNLSEHTRISILAMSFSKESYEVPSEFPYRDNDGLVTDYQGVDSVGEADSVYTENNLDFGVNDGLSIYDFAEDGSLLVFDFNANPESEQKLEELNLMLHDGGTDCGLSSPDEHLTERNPGPSSAGSLSDPATPEKSRTRFVGTTRGTEAAIKRRKYEARHTCKVPGCTSKGFTTLRGLEDHTNRHNDVRNFRCDCCPDAFFSRCELDRHLKRAHFIEKTEKTPSEKRA
ncbi:hypothetical protein V5O48_012566 [Marasmius crinis-equi]|uniref:C2H2-type domain-containing protein n=1 Tax=Marasmius crinis-equi TaxID=585013 RepID=A0ABR3F2G5_9AGAR